MVACACSLSYSGIWGRRIPWAREAEIAVSHDHATGTPACLKNKKEKKEKEKEREREKKRDKRKQLSSSLTCANRITQGLKDQPPAAAPSSA